MIKKILLLSFAIILYACDKKDGKDDFIQKNDDTAKTEQFVPDTICYGNTYAFDSTTVEIQGKKDLDIYILEPIQYHGDEIDNSQVDNNNWYGVFEIDSNHFDIKLVKVSIENVYDAIIDSDGEKTGKKIVVDTIAKPLFLVGGNIALKDGIIKGRTYKSYGASDTVELDDKYFLFATGCATSFNNNLEQLVFNFQLIATNNINYQVISSGLRYIPGEGPHIEWSGYLDNDSVPDFIFDMRTHYNVKENMLFISTKANKGDLYKLVAMKTNVGC